MVRRLLAATFAAVLGAGISTAQAAVPSPATGLTAATFVSAANSWKGPGTSREATGAGSVTVVGNTVTATFSDGTLLTEPPTATGLWSVGQFGLSTAAGATDARFAATLQGDSCSEYSGTIDVWEVTYDAETLVSFAASYSASCYGQDPNVGEIRYSSAVPYVWFGETTLGQTAPEETVVVTAAADTVFDTAAISTAAPVSFRIVGDTCSGQTVLAGATCSVTVRSHPTDGKAFHQVLRLPTVSGDPERIIPVSVTGIPTARGAYTPVAPARILDTRTGNGTGGVKAKIGAGQSIDLLVASRGGIPASGLTSVVLNVTAIKPSTAGYITAYPKGTARPGVSSINFNTGWVGANLVTVRLGAGGKVTLYNNAGTVDVAADVLGFYNDDVDMTRPWLYGSYQDVDTQRLVDTRTWAYGKVGTQSWVTIPVSYGSDIDSHIQALAVNVTVVNPDRDGHLIAWNGNIAGLPKTSALNFVARKTVPNMQIVPVDKTTSFPQIGILNNSPGSVHIIVDIVGFFDDGQIPNGPKWYATRYQPRPSPARMVNSRAGIGMTTLAPGKQNQAIVAPAAFAGYNTFDLVTNTTAYKASTLTNLTLWANSTATKPLASNLNPYPGQYVSNMTITEVWTNNDFRIANANGTVDVMIDVAGTMEAYPGIVPQDMTPTATAAAADTGGTAKTSPSTTRPARADTPMSTDQPKPTMHRMP